MVIVGVGGHHAGRDSAWGGCYFNDTAIAIKYAKERLGARRFAIVDTDTHHGDGTRGLIGADEEVLHLCLCNDLLWSYNDANRTRSATKICVSHGVSDKEEIEIINKEVPQRLEKFKPDLIYWVMGLDTHKDSYGTASLTERCYPEIAKILKEAAEKVCDGKLIVRTSCNAPGYVTEYIMPRIVNILAEIRNVSKRKCLRRLIRETDFDPNQLVSFEKPLMSQVVQQEALIRLLVEKGIFTKDESLTMAELLDYRWKRTKRGWS